MLRKSKSWWLTVWALTFLLKFEYLRTNISDCLKSLPKVSSSPTSARWIWGAGGWGRGQKLDHMMTLVSNVHRQPDDSDANCCSGHTRWDGETERPLNWQGPLTLQFNSPLMFYYLFYWPTNTPAYFIFYLSLPTENIPRPTIWETLL